MDDVDWPRKLPVLVEIGRFSIPKSQRGIDRRKINAVKWRCKARGDTAAAARKTNFTYAASRPRWRFHAG